MMFKNFQIANSSGRFGIIPDPPEIPDCKERFIEEFCQHCSEFEKCKAEYERLGEDHD